MSDAKRVKNKPRSINALPLGLLLVVVFAALSTAASYVRTTLKELTTRANAIVEVEVVNKAYPPLLENQNFPRTHVELKTLRSFKGDLPESFTLDIPGGINGNVVSYVPDGPDFKLGERAIVFVKEPQKGHFMVQDLGLGKFNVAVRENQTYVESPICPKAFAGKVEEQKDLEANLLTRAIPYETFCHFVTAYVAGTAPQKDAAVLAATLPSSSAHMNSSTPSALEDFSQIQRNDRVRQQWLFSAMALAAFALLGAVIVFYRRRAKSAAVAARNVKIMLVGALLVGAGLGGISSNAFVQFSNKTVWNLDTDTSGKVANNRIIWRQSTAVSKTNADCFAGVQRSFDKWEAVNMSRLAFTAGGTTNIAVNDSKDNQNTVAWTTSPSDDFSSSTLAITFSSFTVGPPSNFIDGDIIFNDRDFNWGPNGDGNSDSVSLHEIGHFVGLNHTTSQNTVMFPFDGGLTALSSDEIAAAQALYPGPADPVNNTPPPAGPLPGPNAVADGSPLEGQPPLDVSLTAEASTPGSTNSPIVSYEWDFGDQTTGTGATVSHTYTAVGTFTASVRVTDQNGSFSMATVKIEVGKQATVTKGGFKLNFAKPGKDSFNVTFISDKLVGIKSLPNGGIIHGSILIGDQEWIFDFDTFKAKSVNFDGPKIKVNDKTGIASVQIKNADLVDVLGNHGASNDDNFGSTVTVPVTLWMGENTGIYLFKEIQFFYKSKLDKSGSGKF